jgi:hypothetical protein
VASVRSLKAGASKVNLLSTKVNLLASRPRTISKSSLIEVPNTNDDSSDDEEATSEGGDEDFVVEDFTADDNAKVIAQAVRKESKSASKLLLSKVGKTLMGRLSYIRHQNQQKSSFSTNGFVNGIQVSFM